MSADSRQTNFHLKVRFNFFDSSLRLAMFYNVPLITMRLSHPSLWCLWLEGF